MFRADFNARGPYLCRKFEAMVAPYIELRHQLHRYPELSGNERMTARRVLSFLRPLKPDRIVTRVGGHGILAVFDSGTEGPTVLFRADMDALPLNETTPLDYASENRGVSHKCGHDGHTAILTGLAAYVACHRPSGGRLLLLFQPAEETGKGASAALRKIKCCGYLPDYAFALHNLPGYPRNSVIVRHGTFAAASKGMIIKLKGKPAHASEPEKGKSPAAVMARLMVDLPALSGNGKKLGYQDFVLLTLVHGNLGMPVFTSTPDEAVLMATLRAYLNEDMEILTNRAVELVKQQASASGLGHHIHFTEEFPATINHPDAVDVVCNAAQQLDLQVIEAGLPFRWSEDFAHFVPESRVALFGIGAGEEHLSLHHPDYDFPDDIIPVALELWKEIYRGVMGVGGRK